MRSGPQICPLPETDNLPTNNPKSVSIQYDTDLDVTVFQSAEGLDIRFKLRVLADCLICGLCGGFFRNATTIKECLHTFCRVCILKYLISVRSNCPKCRITVEGNLLDGLVTDTRLQNLVDKLFPLYKANDARMMASLWTFLGRKAEDVLEAVGKEEGTSASASGAENARLRLIPVPRVDLARAIQSLQKGVYVKVSILPDPQCPRACQIGNLRTPYLIVSGDIPVRVFGQFIAEQLKVSNASKLELWLGGRFVPPVHSLEFACRSQRFSVGSRGVCVPIVYRVNEGG